MQCIVFLVPHPQHCRWPDIAFACTHQFTSCHFWKDIHKNLVVQPRWSFNKLDKVVLHKVRHNLKKKSLFKEGTRILDFTNCNNPNKITYDILLILTSYFLSKHLEHLVRGQYLYLSKSSALKLCNITYFLNTINF